MKQNDGEGKLHLDSCVISVSFLRIHTRPCEYSVAASVGCHIYPTPAESRSSSRPYQVRMKWLASNEQGRWLPLQCKKDAKASNGHVSDETLELHKGGDHELTNTGLRHQALFQRKFLEQTGTGITLFSCASWASTHFVATVLGYIGYSIEGTTDHFPSSLI